MSAAALGLRRLAGDKIAPLPGKSLRPILAGEQRTPHEALYFHLFDHRAVIAGDLKLVSDWGRPWELFNLATDRTELRDLSKAQPEDAARLEKLGATGQQQTSLRVKSAGGEPIYRRLADVTERFVGGGTDAGDEEMKKPKKKRNKDKPAPSAEPAATAKGKAIRARIDTKLTIDRRPTHRNQHRHGRRTHL